ncbi:MAG: hypothetical protein LBU23_00360 [Planctomycetota bacterium]|jgi:hypothetical protein|nr:hypothetical protein [Planctomycetota bacterium]
MSNAKNNREANALRELLGRKAAGAGPHPPPTLDHLAFAVMDADGIGAAEILEALERMRREFVDWNEIRVTRGQELARALGNIPGAERIASRLKIEYNAFFEKRGELSLNFLASAKLSEAKRWLAQTLPLLSKAAAALILREFCPGTALPLSDAGLRQARKDGAAGKNPDRAHLSAALAANLTPAEAGLLIQYWELEASGHPYGPAGKKDSAALAAKHKKQHKPEKRKAEPAAPPAPETKTAPATKEKPAGGAAPKPPAAKK